MYADEVCALMEGMVGTMTAGSTKVATQVVSDWVEMCKYLVKRPGNRGVTDWAFKGTADIDESANDLETGAQLFGLLLGHNGATLEPSVAINADADGTLTVAHTDTIVATGLRELIVCPVSGTEDTEVYVARIFVEGINISGTNHLCIGADGSDGTNVPADDLRGWALYRTTPR